MNIIAEKKEGAATLPVSAPSSNDKHSLSPNIPSLKKNNNQAFEECKRRAEELKKEHETFVILPSIPSSEPFPFDALGQVPGKAANAICELVKAADSVCGLSILAAIALAVQAHANVDIGYGIRPISLFCLSIAESGERKSAVDRIAISMIKSWQKAEERCFIQQHNVYRDQHALWDKRKKDALNKNNAEQLLSDLPPEPVPPLQPYIICEEPTYEGLVELYKIGQPTAGIFSDDGGRLVGGYAFNEDNKLKTAAGLSSIWDGNDISWVRKSDGSLTLRGKRLSVHLMLQDVALQSLIHGGVLEKQGLLSRFLLVQPDQLAGSRTFVDKNPSTHSAIVDFNDLMVKLLDQRLPIDEASPKKNELNPRTLKPTSEAQKLWVDYYHEVEFQEGPDGKYSSVRSFASKSGEQAFRIAATLALADDLNVMEISAEQMRRGMTLARYFLNETLRVFSGLAISQKTKNANILFKWMVRHPDKRKEGWFTIRTLMQFAPNALREGSVLQEAIRVLQDHGYVTVDEKRIYLNKSLS